MSHPTKEAEIEGDTFLLLTASQTACHSAWSVWVWMSRGTKKWLNDKALLRKPGCLDGPGDAFCVGCWGLGASAGSLQFCVIPVQPAKQCEGGDDNNDNVV